MDLKTESLKFDDGIHEKMYVIGIDDYQVIKLTKLKDGNYSGNLTNYIWESNDNGDKVKQRSQKREITSLVVEELMNALKLNEFETIPDGKNVKGCIVGSGGVTISLTTKYLNERHTSKYWEPQSMLYYRNTKISEILRVREILKMINVAINYEAQYEKFAKSMPDGQYVYGSMSFDKRRKRD